MKLRRTKTVPFLRHYVNWIVKIWGVLLVKVIYNSSKYWDKWAKIGVNIGICLGNNQGDFQLHRLPQVKISQKVLGGGLLFESQCSLRKRWRCIECSLASGQPQQRDKWVTLTDCVERSPSVNRDTIDRSWAETSSYSEPHWHRPVDARHGSRQGRAGCGAALIKRQKALALTHSLQRRKRLNYLVKFNAASLWCVFAQPLLVCLDIWYVADSDIPSPWRWGRKWEAGRGY